VRYLLWKPIPGAQVAGNDFLKRRGLKKANGFPIHKNAPGDMRRELFSAYVSRNKGTLWLL
jgi:hypothetical protein